MRVGISLGMVMLVGALGCTSSGKTAVTKTDVSKAVAAALTDGVKFDGGKVKTGALPAPSADQVKLTADTQKLTLAPGDSQLMSLEADNPDEATDPTEAMLIQFEDTANHIEVPRSATDGGTGGGSSTKVQLHGNLKVDTGVCKDFCDTTIEVKMHLAAKLHSGKVSEHQDRSFTLDCSDDGDPTKCPKASSGSTKTDAGKAKTDAGKAGAGGASSSTATLGSLLGSAYSTYSLAWCKCDGAANANCSATPFPMTARMCAQKAVETGTGTAAGPNCYAAALMAAAMTCSAQTSPCKCDMNALNAALGKCEVILGLDACGLSPTGGGGGAGGGGAAGSGGSAAGAGGAGH